jgi:hypothetical protein
MKYCSFHIVDIVNCLLVIDLLTLRSMYKLVSYFLTSY